jgi:hypothetical protein
MYICGSLFSVAAILYESAFSSFLCCCCGFIVPLPYCIVVADLLCLIFVIPLLFCLSSDVAVLGLLYGFGGKSQVEMTARFNF